MAGDEYDVVDVAVGLRFYIWGSDGITYSELEERLGDYDIDPALDLLLEKGIVEEEGEEDPVYIMTDQESADIDNLLEGEPVPGFH